MSQTASNIPELNNPPRPLSFTEFRKLGRESRFHFNNPFIRWFISLFGPLGVNSRIRNGHMLRIIRQLDLSGERRILDAGCGIGYSSFWLAQHNPAFIIKAIDLDEQALSSDKLTAQKLGIKNLSFHQQDLTTLSEVDCFDLIFSMDVLEHIPDDMAALKALRKAIKQNGYLVLHLPKRYEESNRILPGFKVDHPADHVRPEYTFPEINEKLNLAGFTPFYQRYGYGWKGELAYELNYLFWQVPHLRKVFAFVTHPLSSWLGYQEVQGDYTDGNSLIIIAKPT